MAAYLIGQMTVKDPELWNQYVAAVPGTLAPFGAHLVFRGQRTSLLSGSHAHDRAVVIRFAEQDQLLGWFQSPAYQSLIPLRERAADMVLIAYDEAAG